MSRTENLTPTPNTDKTPPKSLEDLALKLAREGPVKTLPTPRLIRLLFNGIYIAETTEALLVWEHPYYPQYYLPAHAFLGVGAKGAKSEQRAPIKNPEGITIAHHYTLSVGNRSTTDSITFTHNLSGPAAPLKGLAKFNFDAVDCWFEEDAPIYVHPKDPFKRIDILPSSRRVQVFVQGRQVADATSSMHLYETGLPVRYYLPMTLVDVSVLRRSETKTQCPYKGEAEYYSILAEGDDGGDLALKDVVWYYNRPTLESAKIEGE